MNRLNYVLSLLLGMAAVALSQFSGPTAHAKTCEIVKERRCDFKGNCRDEVKEVCTGLSGQRNPRNMPPRAPAKSLVK